MLLTEEERDELIDLLHDLVSGENAVREYLAALLPHELRGRLDVTGVPLLMCERTIEICQLSGYDRSPPALKKVIDALIDAGRTEVTRFLDRLANPPPAKDPLDAMILSNRLPFADRATFRSFVRDMSVENYSRPILAIAGPPDSGRSHSAELIEHYCYSRKDTIFCKVEATTENIHEMGPLEIASDLVVQLGGTTHAPEKVSNAEAWYPELARWVLTTANASGNGAPHRVWIVLDGFESNGARDDSRAFLKVLVGKFIFGIAARRHRIILCDFPPDLVTKFSAKVNQIQTEPLTQAHVAAVVDEIIASQPAIPFADRVVVASQTLNGVLAGQALPLTSLKIVGERLRQAIEKARV